MSLTPHFPSSIPLQVAGISFSFYEPGSHYVALAGLELTLLTRLASNSQRFACLCLPSAGARGLCQHVAQQVFLNPIKLATEVNFCGSPCMTDVARLPRGRAFLGWGCRRIFQPVPSVLIFSSFISERLLILSPTSLRNFLWHGPLSSALFCCSMPGVQALAESSGADLKAGLIGSSATCHQGSFQVARG